MARIREDVIRDMVLSYGGAANVVRFAEDSAQAADVAAELGRPLAVKLVADDVVHKSKAGGVLLGIAPENAAEATQALLARHRANGSAVRGVTIEAMVDPGVEVVVGGLRTPGFGPVVMFGHGGVDIEQLDDVAFALVPLDDTQARELVTRTRVGRALAKRLPDRVADLVRTILAVGGQDGMLQHEDVTEVDLNPIVVSPDRVVAVDARASELDQPRTPRQLPDPAASFAQLRPAIYPESIAVVGASADPTKMGYRVVSSLVEMGYKGTITPISRSSAEICGLPAVSSIHELPEGIDRAVVAIPAGAVPGALADLAVRGVRAAHVYTADTPQLDPALREQGLRMVGPNCMGHYAPGLGITMIAPYASSHEAGRIAFISQSGTYAGDAVRRGAALGLEFSFISSVGNCDDVSPAELLAFCEADPVTKVAAFYIEGDEGAEEFFHLAATMTKPVVLLKGGRTATGGAAAASHTGAMASDPQLLVDICAQSGVLLVDDLDQLLDVLLLLQQVPDVPGDGLGLLGSGGGVAVVGADSADRWQLTLPHLGDAAVAALEPYEAPGTSLQNPVDVPVWSMFRGENTFTGAMADAVALEGDVDVLCAFLDVGTVFDLEARGPGEALLLRLTDDLVHAQRQGKPLVLVLRSSLDAHQDELVRKLRATALAAGVACFDSVDRAVAAIGGARFLARSGKTWAATSS
jgi:acyl-CoA synthetase (NDP forming)